MTLLRVFLIVALLPLMLSGCSHSQQDALLQLAIDAGRSQADLTLHQAHTLDVDMRYLERPGNGPVVLLVHGFSANKDTWLRFARYLPDDYHLIIPDLAGHGDTPAADSYDLFMQAKRLQALAEHLQIPAWHIAGNSMGGAIAAIYAVQYPQQLQSLTLIDAAGVEAPKQSPFFAALEQGHNPLIATDKDSFEQRWHMTMSQPPLLPWPLRPALVRQTLARENINRDIFADMLATRESLSQQAFAQQLSQTDVPALIMWGKEDQVLDVSSVDVFKRHLPQAQVVRYADIGHLPMVETPEQSADDFIRFIEQQRASLPASP